MACTPNPDILSPLIYNAVVYDIRADLVSKCTWIEQVYGVAELQERNKGPEKIKYPGIYDPETKAYFDLFPSSEFDAIAFFEVGDLINVDWQEEQATFELTVVVWASLPRISTQTHDFTDQLIADVLKCLRDGQHHGDIIPDSVQVQTNKTLVWGRYDYEFKDFHNHMYPYTTFAVTMQVVADLDIDCLAFVPESPATCDSPECSFVLDILTAAIDASEQTYDIELTASRDSCEWEITEACEWVEISPNSGTGSDTITITVEANDTLLQRVCVVTVEGLTHTITQAGVVCELSIDSLVEIIDGTAQVYEVEITANNPECPWTVTDGCDWLTALPASGTGSQTITVTIEKNETGIERECEITIAGFLHTVTQEVAVFAAPFEDWSNRFLLTAPVASVPEDNSNYVALLDLANIPAIHAFWITVKSDGGDIRLTLSNGITQIPFEVVDFNLAAKTGQLWVQTQFLSALSNNLFYLYYGNSSAVLLPVSDANGQWAAWPSVWKEVMHMNQTPNGQQGDIRDSTINQLHGTSQGAMVAPVTGKIGKALQFDGVNDYLLIGDTPLVDFGAGDFQISGWIKKDRNGVDEVFIGKLEAPDANTGNFSFGKRIGNQWQAAYFRSGLNTLNSESSAANTDTTNLIRFMAQRVGSSMQLFINGVQVADVETGTHGTMQAGTAQMTIGRWLFTSGPRFFQGKLDELRIKSGSDSANVELMTYNNQNSPATFWVIGPDETP